MVANVDVGFLLVYVFSSNNPIRNKIEFTESPGPEFEEFKTNGSGLISKDKRNENTWKINNHEYREYYEHPNQIEFLKKKTQEAQQFII